MNTRIYLNIIFLLVLVKTSNAQDTIVFKNGTVLPAKVVEIFSDSITFKTIDQTDSVLTVVLLDSIDSIKYANGKTELFENIKPEIKISQIPEDPLAMYLRGKNDAKIYYRGNGVFWTTLLTSSTLGAGIAAGIIFSTTNPRNIITPDIKLLNNPDYMKGYIKQAKKKRLAKSAIGFGIGSLLFFPCLAYNFSFSN